MAKNRIIPLFLGKMTLIAAFYLGHLYSADVNRVLLNTFDRRILTKTECYQNIGDLEIYLDKEDGEFVPKYGVGDKKIVIGKDMLPLDMYGGLQMRMSTSEGADFKKSEKLLYSILTNSDKWSLDQRYNFAKSLDDVRGRIMNYGNSKEVVSIMPIFEGTGRIGTIYGNKLNGKNNVLSNKDNTLIKNDGVFSMKDSVEMMMKYFGDRSKSKYRVK